MEYIKAITELYDEHNSVNMIKSDEVQITIELYMDLETGKESIRVWEHDFHMGSTWKEIEELMNATDWNTCIEN